ncbi:hypothetical protein [Streptosporangium sandarakinum]
MRRLALLTALAVLTGCGITPTGVHRGGEPPTGISNGMRLYFVSDSGLRGVARHNRQLRNLDDIVKLLLAGPDAAEQRTGLSTLVYVSGSFHTSAAKNSVTLKLARDQQTDWMATGQLVCSLARGHAVLKGSRPDRVQVTIITGKRSAGPYRCPQFLSTQ